MIVVHRLMSMYHKDPIVMRYDRSILFIFLFALDSYGSERIFRLFVFVNSFIFVENSDIDTLINSTLTLLFGDDKEQLPQGPPVREPRPWRRSLRLLSARGRKPQKRDIRCHHRRL